MLRYVGFLYMIIPYYIRQVIHNKDILIEKVVLLMIVVKESLVTISVFLPCGHYGKLIHFNLVKGEDATKKGYKVYDYE